jgi:hypothetical protein
MKPYLVGRLSGGGSLTFVSRCCLCGFPSVLFTFGVGGIRTPSGPTAYQTHDGRPVVAPSVVACPEVADLLEPAAEAGEEAGGALREVRRRAPHVQRPPRWPTIVRWNSRNAMLSGSRGRGRAIRTSATTVPGCGDSTTTRSAR